MNLIKGLNMETLKGFGHVLLAVAPPMILYVKELVTPTVACLSAFVGLIYISYKLYNEVKLTTELRRKDKENKQDD